MGPGKASFAWVRSDEGDVNTNILDARYAGIPLWTDASLELGIDYALANDTEEQKGKVIDPTTGATAGSSSDGMMLTAELDSVNVGWFQQDSCSVLYRLLQHQCCFTTELVAGPVKVAMVVSVSA